MQSSGCQRFLRLRFGTLSTTQAGSPVRGSRKKSFTEDHEDLKDKILADCFIRQMAATNLRFWTLCDLRDLLCGSFQRSQRPLAVQAGSRCSFASREIVLVHKETRFAFLEPHLL